MHRRLIVVAVLVSGFAAACGGNESPAAPTTPTAPTVSSLAISGLDAVRTGFFSNYTATATLSNGTTQVVTPAWTSSNTAIATVDSSGRLDGLTHGSTNLAASHQGRSASKTVQVVNNYGGGWSGTYVVRACDHSGVFAAVRWCQDFRVGAVGPITLALSQSGNDQRQIAGTLALGNLAGNVTGSVTGDGRLNLGGSFNVTSSGVTFTFQFGGWDTRLNGPGVMVGRWAQNLTAIGVTGNSYQENELVTMTQTSSSATVTAAPSHYTLTWEELFSLVR